MVKHSNREAETRESTKKVEGWKPPSRLPTPNREEGYTYRWIRTSMLGVTDTKNISARRREGYEPVKLSEHPELQMTPDKDSTDDTVEIGGLMLCKTPTENVEARKAYFEEHSQNQMASVDNTYLRENDPRMPLSKPARRQRTSFGRGKPAPTPVADDGEDED